MQLFLVFRFQNASGAFLYPIYGQGELSQAFCRRAAVKGCLYVSSDEERIVFLIILNAIIDAFPTVVVFIYIITC